MNCRRVEKLMPLYVEGDLASGTATDLASHLEWCGRCNWLADEYRESQTWLRTSEPLEFDEAFLEDFKSGVLRRVDQESMKPSVLALLIQQWTRRQILALSTAVLVILGVIVFYIYQTRVSTQPSTIEATRQSTDKDSESKDTPPQPRDTGVAPGAGLSERPNASNRGQRKKHFGSGVIADYGVSPPAPVQPTQFVEDSMTGSAQPADVAPAGAAELPEMLRIEIQTSDPSIRIIWFAPKETEIPKTTN